MRNASGQQGAASKVKMNASGKKKKKKKKKKRANRNTRTEHKIFGEDIRHFLFS